MKSFLKMFGAASLLTAALIFSGCGSDSSTPYYYVAPTDTATSTSTSTSTDTGTGTGTTVVLDGKGTAAASETIAATSGLTFTDSAATSNYVTITGFGATNKIVVTGATAAGVQSDGLGTVTITINNGTTTSEIKLPGAIAAPVGGTFVANVAQFNALPIGDIVFQ